jgi:uncharacterized protein (TIGR00369 family)
MRITVDQLQTVIQETPFVRLLGLEILSVDEGLCRGRLPCREQHLQYYRLIHGGVIASLADTMVYMAQATLNGVTHNTVTTGLSVNYLSAVREEDLYAEARILKNGKRVIYGEVSITDVSGRQIARATATYLRLEYDIKP